MLKYFKEFILKRKLKAIKAKIDKKYIAAVEFQRNGNLREYAQSINEVEQLEKSYEKLSSGE